MKMIKTGLSIFIQNEVEETYQNECYYNAV